MSKGSERSRVLFKALADIHRFEHLDETLDHTAATIVSLGEWHTALVAFYVAGESAYGAAGCPDGIKERFRRSFVESTPERRAARRAEILRHAYPGTNVCFIPADAATHKGTAYLPGRSSSGTWDSDDRLMIFMRNPKGEISGVCSLDNPVSGNRPGLDDVEGLAEIEQFVSLIARIAENRFWADRLARSERRFETAAGCSRDWIWQVDQRGVLTYSSPGVEEVLGHQRSEIVGSRFADTVFEPDRPVVEKLIGGGQSFRRAVVRHVRADGRIVTLHSSATAFTPEGRLPGQIGTSRDVTEQIEAEAALRESEAAYRGVFESVNDALVVVDLGGEIVEANPGACRLFGAVYDELIGRPLEECVFVEGASLHEELGRLEGTDEPLDREARLRRRSGAEVAVEIVGTALHHRGRPHVLVVVRDITERKAAFDRLLEEQKDQTIALLAGAIAHDFNNILVGIGGSVSLLRYRLGHAEPGDLELCDHIATSSSRLTDLTRQLLAYARGGRYEATAVSLGAIVEETLALVTGAMRTKIAVVLDVTADLRPVRGDRSQLGQVVMNLVLNACDAMPAGGTLTIRARNVTFDRPWSSPHSDAHDPGDYVRLTVEDTGVGMDLRTSERIFEPFFSTRLDGSGLGLPAVLGIVRGHGGAITFETRLGEGTTMHVHLPRAIGEVKVAEMPLRVRGRYDKNHGEVGTVLIVDDEAVVLDVARSILDTVGWTTHAASSGMAAVGIYCEHGPAIDLVLLDVQMPGMNGADTFAALRDIDPSVGVVFSSGYTETFALENFGPDDRVLGFIPKPYTMDDLANGLSGALRRLRGAE